MVCAYISYVVMTFAYVHVSILILSLCPNVHVDWLCTLRKLAHAVYRELFQKHRLKISLKKNIVLIIFLKTLIVGTR